jgi:glycerol uptake facilitator-like aquaporin
LSHVHAITVGRVAIGMLPPALTLLLAGTSRLPLVAAFTLLWARRRA